MFAKNIKVKEELQKNWNDLVIRKYIALVSGNIKEDMTLKNYIGINKINESYITNIQNGKLAITNIYVKKNYHNKTLLDIDIKTGRKNQIRLQLANINHSIIGDKKYGNIKAKRMYLHAYSLEFIHPITKKRLKLKNISEYEFEVIKTKAKLENDNEVEIYFKPIKNSRIKESIFCYWCLIYEEEISDKKIHPEGDIFLNKVLISELTKKKYYQSVFLEIENNKGHILETGTEINFIEILKYLKEESCEGCEELKNYFEKMQDYVLLAGIKINRKNKIL